MQNYIRWFVGIALIGIAVYGNSAFVEEPLLYRIIGVIIVSGLGLFVAATTSEGRADIENSS